MTPRQIFQKYIAQTSDSPLAIEIESAKGVYMFGKDGDIFIDLISGISVSNLGHQHPDIIDAIKTQADKYLHLMVYGELIQGPQAMLAMAMREVLPPDLDNIFFVNSGSEAIEGALKLVKRASGRAKIAAFKNAYHGATHGALALMSDAEYLRAFAPLPLGVCHLNFNHLADLELLNDEFAAVVLEPIQGEAGYQPANDEFIKALQNKCKQHGILIIADEIQSGMGRTGKWFAFEHYNLAPDVVCLAKAFGAGLPLGAFIANKSLMSELTYQPVLGHITTFGGHPLSCAAAAAGFKTIKTENLIEQVEKKSLLFKSLLQHKLIKSITGKGLMLAIEFDSFEQNKRVIDACLSKGLFTDWFLFAPHKMRVSPPLVISEQEIEKACEIIIDVLNHLSDS